MQRKELERNLVGPFGKMGLSKEGQEFLKELLTTSELVMLSRRVQIARMLLAGATVSRIQTMLHTSPITIASVDRWLEGKFRAYRTVLTPLKRATAHRPYQPYTFNALRRNYPAQSLLLNVLLGDPSKKEID